MNTAHLSDAQAADMDETAEHAIRHPFVPQGCTQQGRLKPTIEPKPPIDRVREAWDDDQSDSADGEVLLMLIGWLCWLLLVCFAAWACAGAWEAYQ